MPQLCNAHAPATAPMCALAVTGGLPLSRAPAPRHRPAARRLVAAAAASQSGDQTYQDWSGIDLRVEQARCDLLDMTAVVTGPVVLYLVANALSIIEAVPSGDAEWIQCFVRGFEVANWSLWLGFLFEYDALRIAAPAAKMRGQQQQTAAEQQQGKQSLLSTLQMAALLLAAALVVHLLSEAPAGLDKETRAEREDRTGPTISGSRNV